MADSSQRHQIPPTTSSTRNIPKYLDTQKEDIFNMYVNYGWPIDEIHRKMVHFKHPWFTLVSQSSFGKAEPVETDISSASQLRTAINRWKSQEPARWVLPPATARPISAPAAPPGQTVYRNDYQPSYFSEPTALMRTGMLGIGGDTMAASFDKPTPYLYVSKLCHCRIVVR
jgi:hypothetical protein